MLSEIQWQNKMILNLLINMKIEQEALRNVIARHIVETTSTSIEDISNQYTKDQEDARKTVLTQLKSHYGIEDAGEDLFSFVMK
ncbi:MAG: hypothetical protein WAT19_14465 [Ferruginibacter sp.]